MLRLDLNNFLQVGLVEVLAGIGQYIFGLLLEHLEQENRDHVLQFGVLTQVGFVVDPVLHFLAI